MIPFYAHTDRIPSYLSKVETGVDTSNFYWTSRLIAALAESDYASTIQYHDENSLSSVLTIAYLSSMKYYFKPIRELPTGRGFADFVYLPKPEYREDYPALVVEMKWNQKAVTAIEQIKEKRYPESLKQYTGDLLLAGISYNKKTKEYQCKIESNHD